MTESTQVAVPAQNNQQPSFKIQVPIEELRKRSLFLATPMYGGSCTGMFTRSVMDLAVVCAQHGIKLTTYFLFNESLVQRARNYCTDEFLRNGSTHMLFLDADIGFNPNDVIAMLALQGTEPTDPYDIVCAPYPKKCISWEKIKLAVDKGFADNDPRVLDKFVGDYVFNPVSGQQQIPIGQPAEVSEAGTGFMMIRRSTLEKFKENYPDKSYKPDHVRTEAFDGSREIMAYFDCEIDRGWDFVDVRKVFAKIKNGDSIESLQQEVNKIESIESTASKRYWSEDYYFTQKCRKLGMKVWMCPWMQLTHTGTYVFGGSLADLAALGAPATADAGMLNKKA